MTIPGIKYVVDCGRVKTRTYDHASGISRYEGKPTHPPKQSNGRTSSSSTHPPTHTHTHPVAQSNHPPTHPPQKQSNGSPKPPPINGRAEQDVPARGTAIVSIPLLSSHND